MKMNEIAIDRIYSNRKGRFRLVLAKGTIESDRGRYTGENVEYVAVAKRANGTYQVERPKFGGHREAEPWKAFCTLGSFASWAKEDARYSDTVEVRNAITAHINQPRRNP